MKKKELIFIAAVVLAALALWTGIFLLKKDDYGFIRITADGKKYGTYSLSEDQTIAINGTNVCEIKDGKAKMTEADCPDHLCLKQRAIGSAGGTIVCLPNKVVIEGKTAKQSGEDNSSGFDTAV